KGKLLNVTQLTTKLPNGNRATLEVLEHPGAVLIIPLLSRVRMVLLKQYRAAIGQYIYELPAGTLEKEEKPLAAARREIVEETGYRAGRWTRLGLIYPAPGYTTEKITIFQAEDLDFKGKKPEADEVIETLTVSRRQVKELLAMGELVDAKTICALSMCGWL
ncbi:MAG: NUDIX hydrolase, partial [Deltaproteobacteria bacterium]|nr:NUDIX hydrolase [Deltaproteobacteria bacterium]